jgi:hypothetical protein
MILDRFILVGTAAGSTLQYLDVVGCDSNPCTFTKGSTVQVNSRFVSCTLLYFIFIILDFLIFIKNFISIQRSKCINKMFSFKVIPYIADQVTRI